MQTYEVYWKDAVRVTGVVVQKGVLVLRPHYAIFAPTQGAVNAVGAIAGGIAGAMAGFAVRVVPAQFPNVHAYLAHLAMLPALDFDGHVDVAARQGGWSSISPRSTRVVRKKMLFRGDSIFLWFEQGKDSFRFDGPVEPQRAQDALHLLQGWQVIGP